MRTSLQPRHVTRLRITLLGVEPDVWRDLVVDRNATLHELHDAIQLTFDGGLGAHHLFSDAIPAIILDSFDEFEPESRLAHREYERYGVASRGWPREARRWGNRWTMIDLRDPDVVPEGSAAVAAIFDSVNPLFYSWELERDSWREPIRWACRIDAFEDDLLPCDSARIAVVGGHNHAPLHLCENAEELSECIRLLNDPEHIDHRAVTTWLARTVGPWGTFDPVVFDASNVKRVLTAHFDTSVRRDRPPFHAQSPLDSLIHRFPRSNRAGLVEHLATAGILMPAVVTQEESEHFVAEFDWLLTAAGEEGLPLEDGVVSEAFLQRAAASHGWETGRITQLIASARQFGLFYSKRGRLRVPRKVSDARARPGGLWMFMAQQLLRRHMTGGRDGANTLFLLAIADGSLSSPDADTGIVRIAAALDIVEHIHSWDRSDDPAFHFRSTYWSAGDAADPVRPWSSAMSVSEPDAQIAAAKVAAAVEPLLRTLAPLGLIRDDAGGWVVTDGLREFARAALT